MKNELIQELDKAVMAGVESRKLNNFEKAFVLADAVEKLKNILTPAVMKPIMGLQGCKLGFKTDRPYSENIIKEALIEAVLTGVQPVGNHFNIIAGNCYITKEGFGYLLHNLPNFSYEIIPGIPEALNPKTANIKMEVKWVEKNKEKKRELFFSTKVNNGMGADGVIGKATRKARAWLYNTVTGSNISDGDIEARDVFDLPKDKEIVNQKEQNEKDVSKSLF